MALPQYKTQTTRFLYLSKAPQTSAATPPALVPSLPLLICLTATERFALRCDSYDTTGAPRRASLFVTDWTLKNTRTVVFDVHNVFEETIDLYGAPPPRPGDEWTILQRMLTHENAGVERDAAGNIAAVVAKHAHGHRLVDVRLPPTYDRVQLAPVPPDEALVWFRSMLETREAALADVTARLWTADRPPPLPEEPVEDHRLARGVWWHKKSKRQETRE